MTSDHKISPQSGSYTANLLGNIRSHLAGLQGFDVMALELIQNADDAKAEKIIFNITKQGLLVTNSGQFTYCGNLHNRPCIFLESESYGCDYHRIIDVGSGGKLSHSENIGRFGIGFVSTYQVTDHPEIRSSGIKLILHPESSQWFVEQDNQLQGTTFFLPWANNPNSDVRIALGVSHITAAHIDQLANDFKKILQKSLLFLRYVQKAELRREGNLLLSCDLHRANGSELTIRFKPGGKFEEWHILRADAAVMAERLYVSHTHLKTLGRSTNLSIGLRITPEPLTEGFLYAFLPTEQTIGLPLHINADFFPESDRKAVIFAGHQHEQAWNEMLIDAAAKEVARDPESLLQRIGNTQLWLLLNRAYELSKSQNHPVCFSKFWERIKASACQAHIVLSQDGSMQCPDGVFLPRTTLNRLQVKAFQEIGGFVAVEELRSFHTAMNQMGAPILTLERMVNLLNQAMGSQVAGESQITDKDLESSYQPLWGMINDLLPDSGVQAQPITTLIQKLSRIPIVITEDLYVVTIKQSYLTSTSLDAGIVASILPTLAIASHHLLKFPKIASLFKQLELEDVANHIHSMCASNQIEEVIKVDIESLRNLYTLFSDLDQRGSVDNTVYQTLLRLPIWLSSRGLIKAENALLPGDYNDPTGQSNLLDVRAMTEVTRDFISIKLGVKTQTIEAFVQNVLPSFFNDDGPLDAQKYSLLISELANHPSLVNDDNIRLLFESLPIVPTQDGNWSNPPNTYKRTEGLIKVLGDSNQLWLDSNRIPNTRSVHNFLDSIGISQSPIARHLVDRMTSIAERFLPTEDAKRNSADAFYVLCDNYDEWKDKESFKDALADLCTAECFPAEGDGQTWYSADSLYAPYRSEAFKSQAHILEFRTTTRLNNELLEALGLTMNPETEKVVKHLLYCAENGVQPHVVTYQLLNERALKSDPQIANLSGSRCIYIESQEIFVRPNQLYWTPQQLGRYAFTIPDSLESYRPLFNAIGVKNSPDAKGYVDILLDVVGKHFEESTTISGADRKVYDACLIGIANADETEQLDQFDFQRLQKAPAILNLKTQPTYPDELFLQDSDWHTSFFKRELDRALCKPSPELWPFLEKIGVKRLSDCAEILLEFVDGNEISEDSLAEKLKERTDIFARLLHDKPTKMRCKFSNALSELKAVSYDLVRIQATVNLGDSLVISPSTSTQAFYDIDNHRLILARPIGDKSWPHILNAIFHQLMPDQSGSEISRFTLSVRHLMIISVEDAHLELTDAGIPYLVEVTLDNNDDLTSPDLDDLGASAESDDGITTATENEQTSGGNDKSAGQIQSDIPSHKQEHISQPTSKQIDNSDATHEELAQANLNGHSEPAEPDNGQVSTETATAKLPIGEPEKERDLDHSSSKQKTKKRAKHKEQWDRRLLSYVRKKAEESGILSDDNTVSEHNLAVETVARSAVCAYEKARGRIAVQMPQTHPGYDIISQNPITTEDRFIEVKGINGEWNKTGVGLSRLQFSNAQEYGETYWLYVVEFISDPKNLRIHTICNPAFQVTAFMFDGSWRAAVSEEQADPALAFMVGELVKHRSYGLGRIESLILKGSTRVMSINFSQYGKKTISLNLHEMEVVEGDYGEDVA